MVGFQLGILRCQVSAPATCFEMDSSGFFGVSWMFLVLFVMVCFFWLFCCFVGCSLALFCGVMILLICFGPQLLRIERFMILLHVDLQIVQESEGNACLQTVF